MKVVKNPNLKFMNNVFQMFAINIGKFLKLSNNIYIFFRKNFRK